MSRVLNRQLRTTKITITALTAVAAPQTTSWDVGAVVVEWVEIMVPRGHAGLTGIHIDYQGVALIPFSSPAQFLIARDETIRVDLGLEVGAPLSVVAYNVDVFPHSFYLRAFVDLFLGDDGLGAPATQLLDLSAVRA